MTHAHTHPISPESVAAIRVIWNRLADTRNAASQLFLDRLSELMPDLEINAIGDANRSEAIAILDQALATLGDSQDSHAGVAALGRLAASAGLGAVHHPLITAAVLWTLEDGLGEPLTFEARRAWAALCANAMAAIPHTHSQR